MATRPTGTITFLFSDIEGSTAAWDAAPTRMPGVLARHDVLVRAVIDRHGGYVFATGGDGFAVAFERPSQAVATAVESQRAIRSEPWPDDLAIRVRMAINTGEVDERDGDYFGPPVNRTARLMSLASGGQVLTSQRTADHLHALPDGVTIEDRGVHQLKDLRRPEQVAELVIDDLIGPPLRSSTVATDRLPSIRTSFVGREHELAEIRRRAAEHRLVTLVGPGGTGKTRLAIEHARRSAGEFPDGVWFVDLSAVGAGEVGSAVLASVGLPATGGWGPLRRWNALLVVDNCEHLVDDAADVVEEILDDCPDLAVVATSREALGAHGEQVVRLGPMALDRGEAARLFVERARAVDPRFDPDAFELEAIDGLCRGLDALPLAIELAASRVGTLDLDDLTTGLLGVSNRRERRRGGRHQSLDAAIRWSVDLMDDVTRLVFRRLAVFSGGFTLDAAIAVVGDLPPLDVRTAVGDLVDQSMLQTTATVVGSRCSMLETIRAFAFAELDEVELADLRRRHLAWITALSGEQAASLHTPGWFRPTIELDNQRAALEFALSSGDTDAAVEVFANSLGSLFSAGRFVEAADLLGRLRSLSGSGEPAAAARLDECDMWLSDIFGDFARSRSLAERFRDEADEGRWYRATSLVIHHLAALSPRDGQRLVDEFEARSGVVPRSAYLRAEIALGESRFADAVDALFGAFDAVDVAGVERRLRRSVGSDPIILADLAISLCLTERNDEAAAVLELLVDTTTESFAVYAPLVRAVVTTRAASGAAIADLELAAQLERRWEPPLVVNDCVVIGSLVAIDVGRPEVAAEALAIMKGLPQRSITGFGLRRVLRQRLVSELGDDGWTAAAERASGRTPREAFAHLVASLAQEL